MQLNYQQYVCEEENLLEGYLIFIDRIILIMFVQFSTFFKKINKQ